jgi:hypothetical protein
MTDLIKIITTHVCQSSQVEKHLERCHDKFVHTVGEVIVACGVLKNPYNSFSKKIFTLANVPYDGNLFTREVGYLYVDESLRGLGISKTIITRLTANKGFYYATVNETNTASINALCSCGFFLAGKSFSLPETGHTLRLLIKIKL